MEPTIAPTGLSHFTTKLQLLLLQIYKFLLFCFKIQIRTVILLLMKWWVGNWVQIDSFDLPYMFKTLALQGLIRNKEHLQKFRPFWINTFYKNFLLLAPFDQIRLMLYIRYSFHIFIQIFGFLLGGGNLNIMVIFWKSFEELSEDFLYFSWFSNTSMKGIVLEIHKWNCFLEFRQSCLLRVLYGRNSNDSNIFNIFIPAHWEAFRGASTLVSQKLRL